MVSTPENRISPMISAGSVILSAAKNLVCRSDRPCALLTLCPRSGSAPGVVTDLDNSQSAASAGNKNATGNETLARRNDGAESLNIEGSKPITSQSSAKVLRGS